MKDSKPGRTTTDAVACAERLTAALRLADSAVGLTFVTLATVAELFALIWAAARRGI